MSVLQVVSMEGRCKSGTLRRKLRRVRCAKLAVHLNSSSPCPRGRYRCRIIRSHPHQTLSPAVVCSKTTKHPPVFPFLCMDMTYITCLLKDGFGFKDSTVLQVRPLQLRTSIHFVSSCPNIEIWFLFHFFFPLLNLVEQEGEQCGVKLGFRCHTGPFLQPEYLLR